MAARRRSARSSATCCIQVDWPQWGLIVIAPRRRVYADDLPQWVKPGWGEAASVCPLFQQMETSAGAENKSHSCQLRNCDCHARRHFERHSLRQAGLSIAIDEPVPRRQVAEGLGFDPIADPEMGIAREIKPGFFARLVQPAKLPEGRRKKAAGAGTVRCLVPQSLDRRLILSGV